MVRGTALHLALAPRGGEARPEARGEAGDAELAGARGKRAAIEAGAMPSLALVLATHTEPRHQKLQQMAKAILEELEKARAERTPAEGAGGEEMAAVQQELSLIHI